MRVLIIAKEPIPGLVKTRLTPFYTPGQAAELAAAALVDTVAAVASVSGVDPVLVLAGNRPACLAATSGAGWAVVAQRGDGLAERLSAAFEDAAGNAPALLVGMDTPQVTPALLAECCTALTGGARCDGDRGNAPVAALGAAPDGGWWALGLSRTQPRLLDGVPMSSSQTAVATRARLMERGYRVVDLPELRDVDLPADAAQVAAAAPRTRFAAAVRRFDPAAVCS